MARILHDTRYIQSRDMLFTPNEVASARARYAREVLKRDRNKSLGKPYQRPAGYVVDNLFFSVPEVESAKKRYVNKKSQQLRVK